ncbi:MAG: adenine phosphoribosyltransferase [Candidatus Goldbacteria bacterium]|nr:adenine phosphoribosyltransferase [Candidatus Goldiibacteriota bacterium]
MEKKLKKVIKDVPDFPKPGIIFKDLTPVFKDGKIFKSLIDYFYNRYKNKKLDAIVAVESRGFIIGAPLAYKLKVPFIPARKPGKLPGETYKITYSLEYGTDAIEMHKDALNKGDKVLIIDDLLATGGTANAVASLIEKADAKVFELAFVVELDELKGREKLQGRKVFSIVHY